MEKETTDGLPIVSEQIAAVLAEEMSLPSENEDDGLIGRFSPDKIMEENPILLASCNDFLEELNSSMSSDSDPKMNSVFFYAGLFYAYELLRKQSEANNNE